MNKKIATFVIAGLMTATVAVAIATVMKTCDQLEADPSLEEQERHNEAQRALEEQQASLVEREAPAEAEASEEPGLLKPQAQAALDAGEPPPTGGGRESLPNCDEDDGPPKAIVFEADNSKNVLMVVDVNSPKNWENIRIHYDGCAETPNAPRLNGNVTGVGKGEPMGKGEVSVGDYIQVYPRAIGCVFTLRDSDRGPPVGWGNFPGEPLDILFSVNEEDDRLEISGVNDQVSWTDITVTRSDCVLSLGHGGEIVSVSMSRNLDGDSVTDGDFIQVHSAGCSFTLKFWLTDKVIGTWSFS